MCNSIKAILWLIIYILASAHRGAYMEVNFIEDTTPYLQIPYSGDHASWTGKKIDINFMFKIQRNMIS